MKRKLRFYLVRFLLKYISEDGGYYGGFRIGYSLGRKDERKFIIERLKEGKVAYLDYIHHHGDIKQLINDLFKEE